MYYFIVTYQALIDGGNMQTGIIGVDSPTNTHQPNRVKDAVKKHYRNKFPNAKNVAVVLLKKEAVTKEKYFEASPGFLKL
jgi:hypothetical protein